MAKNGTGKKPFWNKKRKGLLIFALVVFGWAFFHVIFPVGSGIDTIISILEKPECKFIKLLEIAGTVVSISGILAVVDIIKNWIGG